MTASSDERVEALECEVARLRKVLSRRDQFIRLTMGPYVSNEVLDEIIARDVPLIDGERRKVAMLMSDIRGSTLLSEQLSASEYIRMLNHYLEDMIYIADSWQGNILDFVGDEIVVVFGAPKENSSAAFSAVYVAVAMQRRMRSVNAWNARHGLPPLEIGIGVHIGEAVLGDVGSAVRHKYDMIGRNVNLTARVVSFAEGGQILVTDEVVREAGDTLVERASGAMTVNPKGIVGPVRVHDIVGIGNLRTARAKLGD